MAMVANTGTMRTSFQGELVTGHIMRFENLSLLRNGNGHPVHMGVTQWKITRVFSEHDEALINRRLPRELLLRVFSYLDIISLCRSAQVGKRINV